MSAFIQYSHHNYIVWVEINLIGKHKKYCLCYACDKFNPNIIENCNIAQELFELCIRHHITTPVWECPDFVWRKNARPCPR